MILKMMLKPALILGLVFWGSCLAAGCQSNPSTAMLAPTPSPVLAAIPSTTATQVIVAVESTVSPTIESIDEATLPPAVENQPSETPTDEAGLILETPSATNWMSRWPTLTPTPIPTLALKPGDTTIVEPGSYSRVSSPFQLQARLKPGDDGMVYLDLVGEDGLSLYSRVFNYSANRSADLFILHDISFSVNGAAETGRLSITLKDDFGRVMSVNTVELVLVSMGSDNLYPAANTAEHYLIQSPYEDQFISGGVLQVAGLAYPVNTSPLVAELVDENNQVIASAEANLAVPSDGANYAPFEIDIPYSVDRTTFARLSVKQMSDNRISGIVCLTSHRVILKP